jgi:hypothetical protein
MTLRWSLKYSYRHEHCPRRWKKRKEKTMDEIDIAKTPPYTRWEFCFDTKSGTVFPVVQHVETQGPGCISMITNNPEEAYQRAVILWQNLKKSKKPTWKHLIEDEPEEEVE